MIFMNMQYDSLPYIVELGAVPEHEGDIGYKLLWGVVVTGVALAQLGSDHRQVHGPLDDLVVVPSLSKQNHCIYQTNLARSVSIVKPE